MCVEDLENAAERVERLDFSDSQIEKTPDFAKSQMEKACENTEAAEEGRQNHLSNFVPIIRSGDCSHIGGRQYMEDTHVCISDLAEKFGYQSVVGKAVSFYGVFDGHGGKGAAHFVRDNLPRVIVEDAEFLLAEFLLDLEKVVARSFVETDMQFAEACSLQPTLSSGTTALTAMIFGRSLLVANAGDCRAVLSRAGTAFKMSKDHRPSCPAERKRVESLGGFIDDDYYLNKQLSITRALGDWHLEGMKEGNGGLRGPLISDPELKLITLTKDDEFLIIASDGFWEAFSNQNAVDFARRRLQEHNDVKLCCKELIDEAIQRQATTDNLTIVMVCFHSDPPPQIRRNISTEGLHYLKLLLEGK